MRKLFILAAALLVVSSAFAASPALNAGRLFVQPDATFLSGGPATTNNDDSCDIATTPAATLLLPYFEVDANNSNSTTAVNTIFTLTNTSATPQIAHITIWTDWSFPVLDFNIFLTGYDVQGISLYDILNRGLIPVTGVDESNQGPWSNDANPNWLEGAADDCASLPGPIGESLRAAVVNALTTGVYKPTGTTPPDCAGTVGGTHTNAIGYVTVDVAATCSQTLPTTSSYYTTEILYDNVLIGDYQRINPTSTTGNYAGGNPLVHIRAIPEGGGVGSSVPGTTGATNFPYTFYDRYTPSGNREADRRQPLPGVFAARYIADAGGVSGFDTRFAIWREGNFPGSIACGTSNPFAVNSAIPTTRIVRFDESENPSVSGGCQVSPCPGEATFKFPETSARSVSTSTSFPADNSETSDLGGWMWLNLNAGALTGTTDRGSGSSQNWVVVQMTAEGRYGVDFDAAYLGNGCSGFTAAGSNGSTIGPLANTTNPPDVVP